MGSQSLPCEIELPDQVQEQEWDVCVLLLEEQTQIQNCFLENERNQNFYTLQIQQLALPSKHQRLRFGNKTLPKLRALNNKEHF